MSCKPPVPGPSPRKHGRPSKFGVELATRICDRLAAGEALRAICRDNDMPAESTVRYWAIDPDDAFSAQYARAREVGYHVMADELLEIADNNRGNPARDRLRVDTRKWLLSKALPKTYGDRIDVEHSASDELLAALDDAGERARNASRS